MTSEVDRMEAELAGAFNVATEEGMAACVRNLARAVAREEIERALEPAKTAAAMDAAERTVRAMKPDPRTTVAPVSGEPGGVRVVSTQAAVDTFSEMYRDRWRMELEPSALGHALYSAALHLRVEVDPEFLRQRLERWAERVITHSEAVAFARSLGLTLSDGREA